MKNLVLISVCLLGSLQPIYGQTNEKYYFPARNAVYIESLGSSLFYYNLTYDRILLANYKLYLSAALGYQYNIFGDNILDFRSSISPQLNVALRRDKNSAIEIGVGLAIFENTEGLLMPFRLGYRHQKPKGGIFYKVAFTPVLGSGEVVEGYLPWGGVGAGLSF